ncbi:MAG: CvpA family protein [Chloroflexi bacterium]|nr:CvpA family protein [Chloroflexota bacterium]
MNWVDIVILVVVLGVAFMGFRMGIIRAVVTLAGLGLGVYLGGQFHDEASEILKPFIDSENLASFAGFAVIFIGTLVAATVVGHILRGILNLLFLGWLDKLVGAAAGAAIGFTGVAALVATMQSLAVFGLDKPLAQSKLGPLLTERYGLVRGLLPENLTKITELVPKELPKGIIPGGLLPGSGQTPTPGGK